MIVRKHALIALIAIVGLIAYALLTLVFHAPMSVANLPLWLTLIFGGGTLCWDLFEQLLRREFGADLLAGISIVTSVILGEYLAGTVIVQPRSPILPLVKSFDFSIHANGDRILS
jgi:cation transport ATPase